jgi:hypothetical protein
MRSNLSARKKKRSVPLPSGAPYAGVVVSGAVVIQPGLDARIPSGGAIAGLTEAVHGVDSKPGPLQTKGSGTQSVLSG